MARIEDLLTNIEDPVLRAEIEREVAVLKEHVSFGLVFERHIPETVDLLYVEPAIGDLVRLRRENGDALYRVFDMNRGSATLTPLAGGRNIEAAVADLIVVKPFGEPIYPTLTPLWSVVRSEERPFHAVINGENLHALQLLVYLYEGQVDCIYLDPPFNSGAADWKYNNRFVDATDRYRHSKWLAMMERRLWLAKRLLKPDGVLIVAIDENEVHHLGVLLEELFRDYQSTIITVVTNPKGTGATNFSRVEEYALFVSPEAAGDVIQQMPFSFGMPPGLEKTRDHRVVDEVTEEGTTTPPPRPTVRVLLTRSRAQARFNQRSPPPGAPRLFRVNSRHPHMRRHEREDMSEKNIQRVRNRDAILETWRSSLLQGRRSSSSATPSSATSSTSFPSPCASTMSSSARGVIRRNRF
jgi:adenine-specific DNA-methyltransferase